MSEKKLDITKKIEDISFYLSIPAIFISLYLIFMWASYEKTMGAVQKIFYFHVGFALSSYIAIFILFCTSLSYLLTKEKIWDLVSEVSATIAFLLTSIVLVTGMIWGKAAWGAWFNWEPRLVSFLLIWLMLLSLVVMRKFSSSNITAELSSVLGIVCSILTPVMIYSIKFLPNIMQLHPEIERGGLTSNMKITLLVTTLSCFVFTIFLLSFSFRIKYLKNISKNFN